MSSVLRVENLCLRRGQREILRGVNMGVERGELKADPRHITELRLN